MSEFIKNNLNLVYSIAGIFGILVIASTISVVLKRSKPDKDFTELRQRIQTWWIIVSVFFVAIVLGRGLSVVFFGFVSFLALKEYLSLIAAKRVHRRVMLWAYLSIVAQYWWVYSGWYGMFIIFIPVYMFLLIGIRLVMVGETDGFLRSAGILNWGLMTTVFSLSHIAFLFVLPGKDPGRMYGAELVLFLMVLTQGNDVAQYIWGKSFGKHKIVPAVSPNKTVEGFLGGVGTTVLLSALLAPFFTPMNLLHSLVAGVIISVGGFAGDVTISAVKRDLGVKDSSNMLPGHGGILDRVDSLTFAAPLFLHFVRYNYF